jgi:MFS family permease
MTASATLANPSLLSFPAFMRMWCSRLASTSANQMLMVAVGWQMYDLTGSAWNLGMVGLLQFLPAVLLVLIAGHVVDRFDRARIVLLCMVAQTAIAVLLAVSSHRQWASRELLFLVSVLLGTVKAFQMPSQQALTPSLVPATVLPRALAFSSMGSQAAIVLGPALGGFIYVAGPQAVYAVCAVLFALSGALVSGVHYEQVRVAARNMNIDTLLAGVRFVRHRPVVLGAISLDLFAVLLGGATALLPIFAKDILHTGPWGLGLLRGAPAMGAFTLSVLLSRWPITRHAGRVLLSSVAIYGAATIVFGLSTSFVVSMMALIVAGAGDMVSVVIRQSLVQLDTPDEMRGRVSAVNSVFIGASNQLGEFESGVSAAAFGPIVSVLLGGVGTLMVAALWTRLFRPLAERDQLVSRR